MSTNSGNKSERTVPLWKASVRKARLARKGESVGIAENLQLFLNKLQIDFSIKVLYFLPLV